MKVQFPRFENYTKHWSNEVFEREVNENNYFHTLDDFKNYLQLHYDILTIAICDEIKNNIEDAIENKKLAKMFTDDVKQFKQGKLILINQYPFGEIREYWSNQYDLLVEEYIKIARLNNQFIKNNKDEVFSYLNESKISKIVSLKEQRKIANKKYYENRRQELNIENSKEKHVLTEEEKKDQRKIANKKYYEKRRQELNIENSKEKHVLTEEEKKEKKKLANKKYYENRRQELNIENSKEKHVLTEEEKKEKKKLANKTYYDKKTNEKPKAPIKPLLTDEEKKERKKEANKKYYEKTTKKKEE